MEEKDKWIKNLRHRMEDYSEPAPADLWNQLEKELNSTPKIIPLWRRWQAVAAIALLVVISTVTVWFWHFCAALMMRKFWMLRRMMYVLCFVSIRHLHL